MQTLPRLITVETFASQAGINKHQGYEMARRMPPGILIKLGRRVRLDADRLADWLRAGGTYDEGRQDAAP